MNRLFVLVSCGLLFSVSALPAAAQPVGPCSLISDDALSQVLGSPAHVLSLMSNPIAASAGTMGVADMCYAQLGGQNVVMITHMVGLPTPGDANGVLAMTQGGPTSVGSGGGQLDPSTLTTTPISGLGDAAMLLTGGSANQQYANLIVWRGSEGFSIVGTGLPDAQTSLTGVAQAVLSGQPTQP